MKKAEMVISKWLINQLVMYGVIPEISAPEVMRKLVLRTSLGIDSAERIKSG